VVYPVTEKGFSMKLSEGRGSKGSTTRKRGSGAKKARKCWGRGGLSTRFSDTLVVEEYRDSEHLTEDLAGKKGLVPLSLEPQISDFSLICGWEAKGEEG